MRRISRDSGSGTRGSYDPDDHERLSFSGAVTDFLRGNDTPRAFLERCLETYHRREPEVRAFAYIDEEGARRAADAATARYRSNSALSPVDGCPVAFKDTIETADMPTQQNSALFKGWVGKRDAACVWALRKEGAVVVGKTQVPELALGKPPPTRNPFDGRRTAGGSSSGSGAAVGAGMVPVTIGNQTMGSLIRPASFNANYGFKPTWGALNIGGMHPLAPSLDHIGPMAATLTDMWLIAQRISFVAGGHNGHPGLAGDAALPAPSRPRRLIHLKTLGWTQIDDATRGAFDAFLAHMATGSRSFLSPWSMVGGPSLALPWLAVDSMPLGVQLMGIPDTDVKLVAITHWLDAQIQRLRPSSCLACPEL